MVEVLVQVWPNTIISYFNQASEYIKGENLPGFTHACRLKKKCICDENERRNKEKSTG